MLGHELLARVVSAPEDSGFGPGDPVAAIVRRPDPVPCECCAQGEWDMCRNGLYTESGIKGRDGYGAELVLLEADFAIRVAPSSANWVCSPSPPACWPRRGIKSSASGRAHAPAAIGCS